MEKILKVDGMHCKSCELLLSDVVGEVQGIGKVSVDRASGLVRISYENEDAAEAAKKAIEKEGYKVSG